MSVPIGTPLNDPLAGDPDEDRTIFGDVVDGLTAGATSGDGSLTGGGNRSNTIFGDAGGAAGGGVRCSAHTHPRGLRRDGVATRRLPIL